MKQRNRHVLQSLKFALSFHRCCWSAAVGTQTSGSSPEVGWSPKRSHVVPRCERCLRRWIIWRIHFVLTSHEPSLGPKVRSFCAVIKLARAENTEGKQVVEHSRFQTKKSPHSSFSLFVCLTLSYIQKPPIHYITGIKSRGNVLML